MTRKISLHLDMLNSQNKNNITYNYYIYIMFYILFNFNTLHVEKSKNYKDLKSNVNKKIN